MSRPGATAWPTRRAMVLLSVWAFLGGLSYQGKSFVASPNVTPKGSANQNLTESPIGLNKRLASPTRPRNAPLSPNNALGLVNCRLTWAWRFHGGWTPTVGGPSLNSGAAGSHRVTPMAARFTFAEWFKAARPRPHRSRGRQPVRVIPPPALSAHRRCALQLPRRLRQVVRTGPAI